MSYYLRSQDRISEMTPPVTLTDEQLQALLQLLQTGSPSEVIPVQSGNKMWLSVYC